MLFGLVAVGAGAPVRAVWWERPRDEWYLKDAWKAAEVRRYSPTFQLESPAGGGWIMIWGDQGVVLSVSGRRVVQHADTPLPPGYSGSRRGSRAAAEEPVRIETIFGPETPTGRYKHPSCITELANGDLYVAYYGGEGEYARATAVFGARLKKDSARWSKPEPIARNPFYSMGNPVIWLAPDNLVWLFYVVRPGATWSSSRIMAKISTDQAANWSDSFVIAWDAGSMVRGHPIVLSDGAYLLPAYQETGADTEFVPPDTTSFFLRFDPKSRQWSESTHIRSRMGNLQPSVVQLEGEHLLAFCRRGGDYEPGRDGYVVRSESFDGGRTWSASRETEFPNPNAAVELIKLRNGHLLFVFNDSMSERTPLTVAISTDQGRTFPHRRNLAEGPGSFAYPTAIQTRDGKIHVTFTSNERTVLRHAIFEESAILDAPSARPRLSP